MLELGSGPVEPEYVKIMTDVARTVDFLFNGTTKPKKTGFILMVFPFDQVKKDGRCNYMSNAHREDVIVMLREQLRYFEGAPDNVTGTG